jgi:hypothetical protein
MWFRFSNFKVCVGSETLLIIQTDDTIIIYYNSEIIFKFILFDFIEIKHVSTHISNKKRVFLDFNHTI